MANTIYNESCIDTLKRMEDNTVDLVITSPPYNMNLRIRNGEYTSRQIVKEFSTKYDNEFKDNIPIEKYNEFHSSVLRELLRVSPLVFYNIQLVTGSKRSLFKMIGEFSEYLKEMIVWDKLKAQPAMQKGVMNSRYEFILVFDKNDAISRMFSNPKFERGTLDNLWELGSEKKSKHKASFPVSLVEKILTNFTEENQIVYDPFMGSGSTAVACQNLNRKYIGSEISKDYIEIAQERLSCGQLKLV